MRGALLVMGERNRDPGGRERIARNRKRVRRRPRLRVCNGDGASTARRNRSGAGVGLGESAARSIGERQRRDGQVQVTSVGERGG